MNRMNLSHSWEERMMYLASMHFGFPFTNFAFTSTCLKLFIIRKSELNRVCLLEKSGGSERETERETKMETSRTRWWCVKRGSDDVWRFKIRNTSRDEMIQKTARTHRGHLAFLVGQVHPRDVPCRAFEHVRVFEREKRRPGRSVSRLCEFHVRDGCFHGVSDEGNRRAVRDE